MTICSKTTFPTYSHLLQSISKLINSERTLYTENLAVHRDFVAQSAQLGVFHMKISEGPDKGHTADRIEKRRRKLSIRRYLNPQSLCHETCALSLCYNCCPKVAQRYRMLALPLAISGFIAVAGILQLQGKVGQLRNLGPSCREGTNVLLKLSVVRLSVGLMLRAE